MAKLSSTHIYGDLSVDSAITENGQLLSSKYAAASHGTHLTLGTGSGNAFRGDYGNTAYNHSKAAHAPSNAQKNSDITKAEIEAKLTGAITSHTHAYSPTSHASTATTYGVSSASNYGHAMASGTTPKANGTAAVGSETAKFARGDHVHPLQTTVSGNAGTATKLATARTLTIGAKGKSFDGSANVSWSTAEMGVAKGNYVSATTAATAQWYRIATSAVDQVNNLAIFNICGNVGSYHSNITLVAGVTYGKNPTLIQLGYTNFGTGITKARIVYHTTYSGSYAYLELYLSQAKATVISVDMIGKNGWTLVAPSTVGSIPSGYTNKEITLTLDKIVANIQGNVSGSSGSCTGNAATATKWATGRKLSWTGDATGNMTIDGSADKSAALTLANSGVTAGNYGPSANASPAHSGTFSVPYITVDAKGRVTAASTKTITLPASGNTDTKVTYTLGTTTKYYMGGPTATATGTGGITFDTGIYATTTAGQLSVGSLQTRGDITTSGNGSHAIGSTANRFSGIYGANIYSYDKNAKQYASLRLQTEGTADTQGVGRLTAGNNTNAGTAGNAKGQILLYGTNTGYTTITPGYNDTSNITLTLPSAGGTLARTSDNITGSSASCTGNAATATKLKTARTISLGGLLSGSASFDGSANVSISASIAKPPKSGDWFSGGIPTVGTDGVFEVGKYIDFHNSDGSTNDYDVRLQCNTAGPIALTLPTAAGTLARTADKTAGWSTARTLKIGYTGKSVDGTADVTWTLKEVMKGQGLDAANACGTLYYDNSGESHVGRLSTYNDANGDYVQVALYNTSDRKVITSLNMYANHIAFNRYVIASDYIRPKNNGSIDMGASNYRWRTVYSANGVSTTSDRTLKENIKYVRTGETEINYNDMYNFVKNDLELATYNYINSEERHINFIAQDLLANEDGTDNKVGQFIINPVPVPAKEDIENGEPYPLLSYNTNIYTSVLAGALKQSIDKIEELESEKAKMQSEIDELKADLTELKAIVKGLL